MFKKVCLGILVLSTLSSINAVSLDQKNLFNKKITESESGKLPNDVNLLFKKSEECSYWIEQWAPSLERMHKEFVEMKVNTICLEIMDERTELLNKYKNSPDILEYLN